METFTVTFFSNVTPDQMRNVLHESGIQVQETRVSQNIMQYHVEDNDVPMAVVRFKQHHPIVACYE